MSDPRPDPEDIRRQYQVADDSLTTYTPRLLGIPLAGGRRMTQTEADLLDGLSYPQLHAFKGISEDALAQARGQFPLPAPPGHVPAGRAGEWRGTDGHPDAFRHAYWSARLTQQFGEDWARAFTTAHEAVPGNRPTPEAMDLYNNSVGIRIGRENPGASPAELATLVRDAVLEGRMLVVDANGRLQWSDRVPVGQHGLAPAREAPLDGAIGVPDTTRPRYGAAVHPADGPRHAAAAERLAHEPAVGGYLAALQSGDPEAIRAAAAGLVQSTAAQRALGQAQEQAAAPEQAGPGRGPDQGPSLA